MALIPQLQHDAGHFEKLPGLIVEGLRFLGFIINSQLELGVIMYLFLDVTVCVLFFARCGGCYSVKSTYIRIHRGSHGRALYLIAATI